MPFRPNEVHFPNLETQAGPEEFANNPPPSIWLCRCGGVDTERSDRGPSDLPSRDQRTLQHHDFACNESYARSGASLGLAALSCTPLGKAPDRIDVRR